MADLRSLIANISVQNIEADDQTLKLLAKQVIDDYQRDLDSMSEWSKGIEDGKKLAQQDIAARSEPWEGAANFKSPNILAAARSFGDRAVTEIVRGKNIIKAEVIGNDIDGQKKAQAKRVVDYMNWQLNYEMEGWRERQECLVYELPATGSVFKKTFFCPIEQVNKSELIHYPDFAVNMATSTMQSAKSFTQIMDFSQNEVVERINAGLWYDVDIYPQKAEGDEGSNEEQGVDNSVDNSSRFFEQNCLFDLDDDGYQEPYTVTVHESSATVVRIVARYDVDGIFIKESGGVIRRAQEGDIDVELVKIEPSETITKYGFIKNPDGTFLDVGYYHLLGPLTKAINATTNQLLDAGTLANMPNGFLARGFRKRMGNLSMKPGSLEQTDIPAAELQTGIMMNPFREPSQVLLLLNEKLEKQVQDLVVSLDLNGVLAPNAPATTTLALVQEAMLPSSAIMQRIIGSESSEFMKLFVLNSKFSDPVQYQQVLDEEADYEADFNRDTVNVMPTANPEMSSRMQRIQLADSLLMQTEKIALTGGDVRPVMELYFDAIGAEELKGQVYPDPADMEEDQRARMEAQQQQQEDESKLMAIQVDHAEREAVRRDQETQAKLMKTEAEIDKLVADTVLSYEKAESEDVKNQINKYTARLEGFRTAIQTMREGNELQATDTESTAGIPAIPDSQQG